MVGHGRTSDRPTIPTIPPQVGKNARTDGRTDGSLIGDRPTVRPSDHLTRLRMVAIRARIPHPSDRPTVRPSATTPGRNLSGSETAGGSSTAPPVRVPPTSGRTRGDRLARSTTWPARRPHHQMGGRTGRAAGCGGKGVCDENARNPSAGVGAAVVPLPSGTPAGPGGACLGVGLLVASLPHLRACPAG